MLLKDEVAPRDAALRPARTAKAEGAEIRRFIALQGYACSGLQADRKKLLA